MVNNPLNIDDYFKQTLTNCEVESTVDGWKNIRNRLSFQSFFKFNPYQVNVYYVVPVVVASLFSLYLYINRKTIFVPDKYTNIVSLADTIKEANTFQAHLLPAIKEDKFVDNTSKTTKTRNQFRKEDLFQMSVQLTSIEQVISEMKEDSAVALHDSPIFAIDIANTSEITILKDENSNISEDFTIKKKSSKKRRPLKMH